MTTKHYKKLADRSGKGAEKLLGELELDVMHIVWAQESVTVRSVLEKLTQSRVLAYTTVMTIMSRLVKKGLLIANKQGKTYHYQAAQSQNEFETQAVGRVVQSLISDFGGEIAMSQFIEQLSAVDPEQLSRLAELAQLAQGGQDEG